MKIYENYPLKELTTFKIGGNAEFLIEPEDENEFIEALSFIKEKALRKIILGGGANILFSEGLIKGCVISTRKLTKVTVDGDYVTAGAGILIADLNNELMNNNLSGLEFSGGLPGSLGGAVYMNARCYGSEFADVVESVKVIDDDGRLINLLKEDIAYRYKYSLFMDHDEYNIISVNLCLKKGDNSIIKEKYRKNVEDRQNKGQYEYPSAGCIFKNNYDLGVSSGSIIDQLGLKNTTIGGAKVYEKHANFIINTDNASFKDVLSLIERVESNVYNIKNIKLEREVRVIS